MSDLLAGEWLFRCPVPTCSFALVNYPNAWGPVTDKAAENIEALVEYHEMKHWLADDALPH